MSGSKKGSKRRPYRQGPITPVHVHILTPEELAADEWNDSPSLTLDTRNMLDLAILCYLQDRHKP